MGVIRDRWRIWERQQIIDELALTPTDLPSSLATDAEVAALSSTNLTDSNLIARHKGVWTTNTSWLTGDIVQITSAVANGYPLGLWRCTTTHLGGMTFSGTSSGYWVKLAGDLDSVTASSAYGPGSTQWLQEIGAAFGFAFTAVTSTDATTGLPTAATIRWPDGTVGAFTGTIDAAGNGYSGFVAAYGSPATKTLTASGITYDTTGLALGPTGLAVA